MSDRYDPDDPLADIEPYGDLGEPARGQPPDPGAPGTAPRPPLLTGLVLGLLLVVVTIALFQLLSDDSEEPGQAADTTTPTDTATDGTGETGGTATDGTTTGTGNGGGNGDGGGNGGVDGEEPIPTYEPVGEAIPVTELTMATDGIGPVELGQDADEAIGRLVSSLGTPEEDTGPQTATGEWGVCEGDTERIIRWGPLAAIVVVDDDGGETFAGYRLDLSLGGFSSPAADLATVSGLQVGTSYRELEERIYQDFDVRRVDDPDLGPVWELHSTETGNLLLWGPLTDEDVVRGIYANDACGTF